MLSILFPKICNGCKSILLHSENVICTSCRHSLPLACHHKNDSQELKHFFYGKFRVELATSLLNFQKKGITQELLHNLKYRKQKQISSFFGTWLGAELSEIKSYKTIDIVIPVPLHKQKLKIRGYNQVEGFGKELAKALQIPYRDDILVKINKTETQVFKQRFKRFQNTNEKNQIFSITNQDVIKNKHILLVDDIVTTGATLENCAIQLLNNTNAKLSIATIAIA